MENGIMEFKGNLDEFEMSRYIDLDLYHAVERSHPYYEEMITEILKEIRNISAQLNRKLKILEIGAGTGILTQELVNLDVGSVDALEIDQNCLDVLEKHICGSVNCILGDAVEYSDEPYDLVVSTFAHDHIHYDRATSLVENIRRNLKMGGVYLMGGELLPKFETSEERNESLYKYHGFIVDKAIRDGNYTLAQIEINAIKSGIEWIGDFKRHESQYEKEMLTGNFQLNWKRKMGPLHLETVGGVFVYNHVAI